MTGYLNCRPSLFSELFDDFSDLYKSCAVNPRTNKAKNSFNINMSENDESIVIECELGGIKKEYVDISVEKNVITIKAERKMSTKCTNFYEIYSGTMSRSLQLPSRADTKNVKANLSDGILTLTIGKFEADTTRKITINS